MGSRISSSSLTTSPTSEGFDLDLSVSICCKIYAKQEAKLSDRQEVLRLIAVKISIYAAFSTLSALGPLPLSPATTSKLTLSPSVIETPGLSPGGVNKIVLSVFSGYKTELLCSVKELYCACYHL